MVFGTDQADPPRSAPSGDASTAAPGRPATHAESVRETLDSVVVAFILAFVFRAFVVEAFVIPTGSMAPTLYGEHGSVTCEDCGYAFAYGLSYHTSGPDHGRGRPVAVCPNCRYPNRNLRFNDQDRRTEAGDRILVFKWPLDVGLDSLKMHRWDVVVFKDPKDGSTNFIKRLIGMPGEVLCILDGDVYAVPTSELSDATRSALDEFLEQKIDAQARPPGDPLVLRRLPGEVFEELDSRLRILRKTAAAQDSLWFTVYNDDFRPRSLDGSIRQPRWEALAGASGWDTSERTLRFDPTATGREGIELRGIQIADDYAYNLGNDGMYPVEDLRVRFLLEPTGPEGAISIVLSKLGSEWTATVTMDGTVRLDGRFDGRPLLTPMEAAAPGWATGRPVEIAFEFVDYRAALSVGGHEVLATTDIQVSPDLRAIRATLPKRIRQEAVPPRIYGEGSKFQIRHLVVERDVYYRAPDPDSHEFAPYNLTMLRDVGVWGGPWNPIMLRDHEYFCMGDNSPQSADSRLWTLVGPHLKDRGADYQLGTVLEDQLIGRAFFVYWPSGHRLSDRIPGLGQFGIIPNVGNMRWIR